MISGCGPTIPWPWQRLRTQRRKKSAPGSPKWSKWLDLASKNTSKSCKNVSPGQVFCKTANMQSARAGAVQTLFLACNLEHVSATMRARRPSEIAVQKKHAKSKYVLRCVIVLGASGAPKAPLGDHFAIIFSTFCMTWADDLSRLVQTSSFNRKTTLQTYNSTVSKPKWSSWYPNRLNLQINQLSSVK